MILLSEPYGKIRWIYLAFTSVWTSDTFTYSIRREDLKFMKAVFKCTESDTLMYREINFIRYEKDESEIEYYAKRRGFMVIGNDSCSKNDQRCRMDYDTYIRKLNEAIEKGVLDFSDGIWTFEAANAKPTE